MYALPDYETAWENLYPIWQKWPRRQIYRPNIPKLKIPSVSQAKGPKNKSTVCTCMKHVCGEHSGITLTCMKYNNADIDCESM